MSSNSLSVSADLRWQSVSALEPLFIYPTASSDCCHALPWRLPNKQQTTPCRPSIICAIVLWNTSAANEIPNRKHQNPYLPMGLLKVHGFEVSSSGFICQKPRLLSSKEKYFASGIQETTSSTVSYGYGLVPVFWIHADRDFPSCDHSYHSLTHFISMLALLTLWSTHTHTYHIQMTFLVAWLTTLLSFGLTVPILFTSSSSWCVCYWMESDLHSRYQSFVLVSDLLLLTVTWFWVMPHTIDWPNSQSLLDF